MTAEFGRFRTPEQGVKEIKPQLEKIKAGRALSGSEFSDLVANILGLSAVGVSTNNISDLYPSDPAPKTTVKSAMRKGARSK